VDRLRDRSLFSPLQNGDVVADRYEILEFIGAGGMGLVYRCRDRQTSRVRALKTLRLDLEEEQRSVVLRLLRSEADALRRVESDFVVRIFDSSVGSDVAHPFVVMELLRGQDLEQVLKEGRPSRTQALAWLWQAACGLRAIHGVGVVHRDLKPANLFLNERDDGSTELKILDFSISRLLDGATGKTTIIVGTKGFMSPEQAAGYDVDLRSDIFALGQVARTLLEPTEAFSEWHRKATAADRRERFGSAIDAVRTLAVALGVTLPGRLPLRPGEAVLSSATTVFAPSAHPRRLRAWALAGGATAAAVAVTFVISARRDSKVELRAATSPIATVPVASAAKRTILETPFVASTPTALASTAPVPASATDGKLPSARDIPSAAHAPRGATSVRDVARRTPGQPSAAVARAEKASDGFW